MDVSFFPVWNSSVTLRKKNKIKENVADGMTEQRTRLRSMEIDSNYAAE